MGVSERRLRRAVQRGARTVEEVGEACEAGTCCLSCHPTIEELIEAASRSETSAA